MVLYLCRLRLPAEWKGEIPKNPELAHWKRHTPNMIFILDDRFGELVFCQVSRWPDRADEEFKTYCKTHALPSVPYERTEVTSGNLAEALRTGRLVDEKTMMGKLGPFFFLNDLIRTEYYEWIAEVDMYGDAERRLTKARQSRCAGMVGELERIRRAEGEHRDVYAILAGAESSGRNRTELLVAERYAKGWTRSGRVCVIRPQDQSTNLSPQSLGMLYRLHRDATVMVLLDKTTSVSETVLSCLGALAEQFSASVLTVFAVAPRNQHLLTSIEGILVTAQMRRMGWEKDEEVPSAKQQELPDKPPEAEVHKTTLKEYSRPPAVMTSSAMKELDSMIGLTEVKEMVHQIVDYCRAQQIYEAHGFKTGKVGMHMVFYGNPGTAKTTVARLVAQIFKDYGVLEKGKLFEVGRADLVGKWSGWSATQTRDLIRKAKGSVLFVDEAYSLVAEEGEDHFGREALDELVLGMENHRQDLVIILAGYKEPMKRLLAQNAGLASRISWHIDFKDYTLDELVMIFRKQLSENERCIRPEDEDAVRNILREGMAHKETFGNGRYVRNMVQASLLAQASRLMRRHPEDITDDDIRFLNLEDLKDPMPADTPEKKAEPAPPKRLIGFLR